VTRARTSPARREQHRAQVHVVGPGLGRGRDPLEERRRALLERRDVDRHGLDLVPCVGEHVDDVVHGRLVAGRPHDPGPTVLIGDPLERLEVRADPLDGDLGDQGLGDGLVR
jgi:hypothetical protein